MSLFRSTVRPPAVVSDEAVERHLRALRAHVEPDPAFRRRLRGEVLNQYVATREGMWPGRAATREMSRIGRAVLYASFTLALSVSSVMAASQEAVPGDPLYPLKRQIESLRSRAVPAHLQDDLAAYVLAERIQELGTLARRGDWDAVQRLGVEIDRDAAALAEATASSGDRALIASYLDGLDRLIAGLPAEARAEATVAIAGIAPAEEPPGTPGADTDPGRPGAAGAPGSGNANNTGDRSGGRLVTVGEPGSASGSGGGQAGVSGTGNAGNASGGSTGGGGGQGSGGAGAGGAGGGSGSGSSGGAPTGPVSGPGGGGPVNRPTPEPTPSPAPSPTLGTDEGGSSADRTPKPRPTRPPQSSSSPGN